jgi:hypothetical protein
MKIDATRAGWVLALAAGTAFVGFKGPPAATKPAVVSTQPAVTTAAPTQPAVAAQEEPTQGPSRWWVLIRASLDQDALLDRCASTLPNIEGKPVAASPSTMVESLEDFNGKTDAKIIDKGEMVEVVKPDQPGYKTVYTFYRSEAACQAAADRNRAAADRAAAARKALLDKYR